MRLEVSWRAIERRAVSGTGRANASAPSQRSERGRRAAVRASVFSHPVWSFLSSVGLRYINIDFRYQKLPFWCFCRWLRDDDFLKSEIFDLFDIMTHEGENDGESFKVGLHFIGKIGMIISFLLIFNDISAIIGDWKKKIQLFSVFAANFKMNERQELKFLALSSSFSSLPETVITCTQFSLTLV